MGLGGRRTERILSWVDDHNRVKAKLRVADNLLHNGLSQQRQNTSKRLICLGRKALLSELEGGGIVANVQRGGQRDIRFESRKGLSDVLGEVKVAEQIIRE